VRRQGRRRLLGLQVGGRHAPRPARARDRVAGADPHLDRDRGGHARGRGGRGRARPERPQDRRLPLDRPRRPERQHDRLRGSHHARADRDRGRDAGREVAAPEQNQGDARVARPALRGRARAAAVRAGGCAALADRLGPARREDPHLQLRREPRDRPPRTPDRAPARQDPRGRAGGVHRGARRRGPAPRARSDKRRLRVTIGDALARATSRLVAAGVESARLESELLLAKACDDCARAMLYAELDREMTDEQVKAFDANLERREAREPLAYILGEWGFRRLTLKTDRRALIPRPETEVVVERALAHIRDLDEPRVLDVGTGTGAIALAIADEAPHARVTAMDVSRDALALARENLELTGINGRVRLVEHDLTSGLGEHDFDLVVSNPPYVEPDELPTLQPEVRDWEPHVALVASGATEKLALAAREALRPGGWLVLETAAGAGERVERLLTDLGFDEVTITPDLAGRDRVAEGRWNG